MQFNNPQEIDQIYYSLRLGDYPRGRNRALINNLMNGVPPHSEEEVEQNNINVNVNYLEGTRITHDARSQFYNAFLKPGTYFTSRLHEGPEHKRQEYSTTVTQERNRIMQRSLPYFECFRSKFAQGVLHGIAPSTFKNKDCWRPEPAGVEDVLVPGNTLLTMENLPFFCIRKSFTAPQLIKMTRRKNVDKGWNMPMVNSILEWVDQQAMSLYGTNWNEIWTPEKVAERIKGDGGFYAGDQVPTIDVIDFYFWSDEGKNSGWRRRMILDAWGSPESIGGVHTMHRKQGEPWDSSRSGFLYNPGKRKCADSLEEIINWQFADLSAVAPFRYHSVRSLGFLLYSVCHLQNRMRSKFSEAVFESLMILFRVKNMDESQKALKADLFNRGFIDDSLEFVKAQDRYQVNTGLVQLGINENAGIIAQNASGYVSNPMQPADKQDKTAFQVMTETNQTASLTGAALIQAYQYQLIEYREIARRFFKKNSQDVEVLKFRAACLRKGVPEKYLNNPEAWDHEAERVLGAGNKTLEMAIAQQLLQMRNLFDPEPQRRILRDVTLAITDDPARAESLVPEKPVSVTDSVHDAQLASAALMLGLPLAIKTGMNHIEYVETLMASMAVTIQKIEQRGGVATMEEIQGLGNMAGHIAEHIQIISQDPNEKQRVKVYGDQLGKLMNMVKAYTQRLQEQMQQNGEQNGGVDPETLAKIQGMLMQAEAKAKNTRDAHAQRTAQRQIQWEMDQQRKDLQAQADLQQKAAQSGVELGTKAASSRIELEKERRRMQMEEDE